MAGRNYLSHFATFLLLFFSSLFSFAGPGKTTYQAKIIKPDGYPLEVSSVNFKFTILDPAGSCILYSETYSSVNMSSTGGLISFALGSGVKTYPASATTFEQVFSNITPSLSCDTGGPANYTPAVSDIRKIVMQFHDGSGWQTLPAMSINAVPYAMYANEATKLNGLTSSDFVQVSTVPTCTASEALRYTGAGFTCVAVGSGGATTSSTIITALGYTPADGASVTTLTSNVSSVSSTVFSVSSTVTSLQNSVAASFAAITSSQWTTSGTNIFYNTGNIGIGTTTPVTKLDVSGGVRIGAESTTCAPALAGTLRYNASNVEYCNGTTWQAFGVSGAGITNFNGSTSGTQSFVTGAGGTAPNFNTSNGVHSLNIPLASTGSVTAGLLSNADYTTFSNKITSSAASIAQVLGYVPADNAASGTYAQKANNLSDLTNTTTARTNLGLGTFATASSIDLGSASATGTLAIARLPSFTGDATIAAASNTIILSNSGVTAGTYTKVTVDAKGRVTSSSALASSDVTTALGYTPANSATIVSSQWNTSGTTINYMNGHVGIGTTSPQEKLHVEGGSLLVTGDWGSGPTLTVSGAGTRMFFYPRKAAFRGGYAYDDEWNENNIGEASFAFGDSVVASGAYSIAMGRNAQATAPYSTAFGQGEASGDYSTAFDSSTAYGLYSVAMGSSSAQGDRAIAMGGSSSANGESSVAIGRVVISNAYRSVAVGSYNIGNGSGTAWIATDPIFEIGNSQNGTPRTNAMTVLKNGNVGVTVSAPTARLHLASGTTSVAPLKFTSGTLLSSPQSGTMEYDGANFYVTDSTNTRRTIATGSSAGTIDNASNINSSGNITLTPTGSVVVSSTTASTNSSTGALVVKGGLGVAGDIYTSGTIVTSSNIQGVSVTATSGMISPYIAGSVASGGSLTLDSTTHATKGNILLAPNGGNVGIGTSAPEVNWTNQIPGVAGSRFFTLTGGMSDIPAMQVYRDTNSAFGGYFNLLKSRSGGPASNNDEIGYVNYGFLNSANKYKVGGSLLSQIISNTDGSETASLVLRAATSGTVSNVMTLVNGNVGVGTSTPINKLDVVGVNNSGFRIKQGNQMSIAPASSTSFYNGVVLENGGSSHAFALGYTIGGYFGLNYFDGTSAYSNLWTITNSGNMGIGTTTPGYALSIYRLATGVTANIESGSNGSVAQNRYAGLNSVGSSRVWGSGLNITDGNGGYEIYDYTAGASRFLINSSGNVGIGTTSPTSKLSMNVSAAYDGIRIDSTSNGFLHSYINAGAGSNNGITQAGDKAIIYGGSTIDNAGGLVIAPWKSNTSGIRLDASGRVGIGTSNPGSRLHIATPVSGGVNNRLVSGNSNGDLIDVTGVSGDSFLDHIVSARYTATASTTLTKAVTFKIDGAPTVSGTDLTVTEKLAFWVESGTSSFGGNVGIGTTSPANTLTVVNQLAFNPASNVSSAIMTGLAAGGSPFGGGYLMKDGTYYAGMWTTGNGAILNLAAGGTSAGFGTANGAMAITSSGAVGIGTTNPVSAKLHLQSGGYGGTPADANNRLKIESSGHSYIGLYSPNTFDQGIHFGDPESEQVGRITYRHSTDMMQFRTNAAERMVIDSSGNVGIGTTSPSYTLDVTGTLRVTGQAYTNTGNGSFSILSDIRYKDVHGNFDRGLTEVLNIDIIKFNYKKDNPLGSDSSREYVGVSAQNLQQVIPEAVEPRKVGKEEYLTINTSPVLWTLINAIKQLYKRLIGVEESVNRQIASIAESKADKAQIEILTEKAAKLEAENAALKAYLCGKDPAAAICK